MIKLQKRAARIILDKGIDTPSVEMFNQLSWMTFPERVTFQKAVMMYKIFNNLTPSYLPEYFKMTSDIHQRSLRITAENLLYISKPNTELFLKSLHILDPKYGKYDTYWCCKATKNFRSPLCHIKSLNMCSNILKID